ncbi:MAG: S-layer homology domain-containing protein [Clostridia bacterium]|nr:S-layer homology domain-containing protein [Clostridia bacterium]
MKKIVALLLVVCMLITALPVFASKTAEQEFSTDKIKGEVIIPFTDAQAAGEYKPSTVVAGYDGGAHYWGSAEVIYELTEMKKGRYELFFWVCPHPVCMEKLEFEIMHAGETSKYVIYQATESEDEKVEPGWVSLGVYDFAGDGAEYVKMPKAPGTTRQSAVKYAPSTKDVTVYTEPVVEEKKDENISSEGVPVIGDKKPDSSSKLKDIEVLPAGKCRWEGDWRFSSAVLGPMAEYPNSMWIAGVGEEATVTYNPQIEAVGDVNVFVYLLWWHENQNPQVKYEVHHNGKVDTVMLDPTTLTESSWVYLGTFDFAGDIENEFVKLVCQKDENVKGNTRASTIMFEIVNTEGGIWQTKYVTPYESIETLIDKGVMAPLDKFADMKDHWAYYDVEYMANEGLVSGVSEDTFDPEAQITRAEYVTILDRAMGFEMTEGDSYADVAKDAWYAPYVATAKANGLLKGLPTDDGFKPEQPITRQEMALFTYNAIKQIGRNDEWLADMPDDYAKFTDTAEVADWAEEALKYLIKTGIIKGTTETTVSALENATRAQGAVILKRFMSYFVWAGPPTDQERVMTFNDEFNGTEMDWSVWRSEAKAPGHIQSSRWPENVEVHDGAVHLVIRHEEREGKEWTAASVWVRPEVFAQKYGYWEARYKIAASSGINNSFWTYSDHTHNIHREPGANRHFEVDINEGHYPNTVNMTYHSDATGEKKAYTSTYLSPYEMSADYHTYALEWTPEELRFYHDGVLRSTQKNLNANQLQFPYLSSAVLNWAGQATDKTHGTAQIVDYVRIWQKKENIDDPTMNFKGEPMVGVGPAEAGTSGSGAAGGAGAASETVEFKTTTQTFAGEIVIPFDSAVKAGEWKASTAVAGYDGGAHYWSGGQSTFAQYNVVDIKKGKYDVYYWLCPHAVCAEILDLEVNANGETKKLASRQKLNDGETVEAGWVKLGTFEFKADGKEYVKLLGSGGSIRTSAVKLVPAK